MSRELDVLLHFLFLTTAIVGWFYCLQSRQQRSYVHLLGWYLFATLIFDGAAATIMLSRYLANIFVSNLFLYHILAPIQYGLMILIYRKVITNKTIQGLMLWSIPLFIVSSIVFSSTQGLRVNGTYSVLLMYAITVMVVLFYFRELVLTTPYRKIYYEPIFWVSVGFLFHGVLNILLEGVSNYLHTYSNRDYDVIWILYSTSNYCLFVLFAIGFFISRPMKINHGSISV